MSVGQLDEYEIYPMAATPLIYGTQDFISLSWLDLAYARGRKSKKKNIFEKNINICLDLDNFNNFFFFTRLSKCV